MKKAKATKAAPAKKAPASEPAIDDKKVLALFKTGKSTGEVCLAMGLPRDSASRKAVREILRAAGTYERRMPAVAEAKA